VARLPCFAPFPKEGEVITMNKITYEINHKISQNLVNKILSQWFFELLGKEKYE